MEERTVKLEPSGSERNHTHNDLARLARSMATVGLLATGGALLPIGQSSASERSANIASGEHAEEIVTSTNLSDMATENVALAAIRKRCKPGYTLKRVHGSKKCERKLISPQSHSPTHSKQSATLQLFNALKGSTIIDNTIKYDYFTHQPDTTHFGHHFDFCNANASSSNASSNSAGGSVEFTGTGPFKPNTTGGWEVSAGTSLGQTALLPITDAQPPATGPQFNSLGDPQGWLSISSTFPATIASPSENLQVSLLKGSIVLTNNESPQLFAYTAGTAPC